MSLIVYEVNEVPKRIFNFYSEAFPQSAFAYLNRYSSLYETIAADVGVLDPWVSWPTMHRGVSNVDHEISDLGQDLATVNERFPTIQSILACHGVKVGVFGTLHSYPLPNNLDNYKFYIPDTFAAGDECFPEMLSDFQSFNLSMVRANGRNVSRGIAAKDATKFIFKAYEMGLKPQTYLKLTGQILSEIANKDRVVRRRSSQAEIAFDLYIKQLLYTTPDISFFFTNHLASSMHRYWPTIFPEDYPEGRFDPLWCQRWAGEIPHAVKVANYQLRILINICKAIGAQLIVCSSMGQAAVTNAQPLEKQVLITKIRRLLGYLGLKEYDWEPRFAMAPRVVVKPNNDQLFSKLSRLNDITINGQRINYEITCTGEVRFDIDLVNQRDLMVIDNGVAIESQQIGVDNIDLQDATGSYAYHIPEGILLHYDPAAPAIPPKPNFTDGEWTKVSVLDFAPSILARFGKKVPTYMKGSDLLI